MSESLEIRWALRDSVILARVVAVRGSEGSTELDRARAQILLEAAGDEAARENKSILFLVDAESLESFGITEHTSWKEAGAGVWVSALNFGSSLRMADHWLHGGS